MSDLGGAAGDDDIGLPKATVFKLIQEMLPEDISCAKEAKDVIVECCVVDRMGQTHLHSIKHCLRRIVKKTISPEHVVEALKQLGFEDFIAEVEESNKDFKQSQKERTRTQPDTNGMTQDELLALQERLFASSQARFEAGQ